MSLPVAVDPAVRPIVSLGVLVIEELTVSADDQRLGRALADAEARVRHAPPAERLAVRAMYRRTGLDPTRRRPSSEALLRRVCRGEPLPRINTLVDICNWCSLELQVPYGLYDLDRLAPPVVLRLGQPGEQYAGIRKDVVHLEHRLALADAAGPFGNPSADSARSMVTLATVRVLVVIFVPAGIPATATAEWLDLTSRRLTEIAGGRETARSVV